MAERYWLAARRCRQNRRTLQLTVPFCHVTGSRTDDILRCYEALTGRMPEDLVVIFQALGWKAQYGGERWAHITEVLLHLKGEINQGVLETARHTCEEVGQLCHNSGRLVPTLEEWQKNAWVREMWPILCEREGWVS